MSAADLMTRIDAAKGVRQRASDMLAEARCMGRREEPQPPEPQGGGLLDTLGGISGIGHTVLDAAGFIPVVGAVADLANAGWYAAEGDYVNAGLSAAGAIPFAGDAAAAVRLGARGVDAATGIARNADNAADAAQTMRNTENFRDFAHGSSLENLQNIQNNGLDEGAALAAKRPGGSQAGSFFTTPVSPESATEGLDVAYGYGQRYAAEPAVLIMRVPEGVFRELEESGAAFSRPIIGHEDVTETVFRPESFQTLNQHAQFPQIVDPHGRV